MVTPPNVNPQPLPAPADQQFAKCLALLNGSWLIREIYFLATLVCCVEQTAESKQLKEHNAY